MNETLKDLDYANYIQNKIHNINRQNLNFGEASNNIIKIIIISNDFDFFQEVVNSMNSQNLKVNIEGVTKNESIASEILESKKVDIIFLERKELKNYSKQFLTKYEKYIIVASDKDIYNTISTKLKRNSIKSDKSNKINKIRNKIVKELEYIGYNFKYSGTHYLVDTILQVYTRRKDMVENLQGYIYPIISKRYNKSVQCIKNNIINSTEHMYWECNTERLKKYFSIYDDVKPSVKQVVFTVINKIQ